VDGPGAKGLCAGDEAEAGLLLSDAELLASGDRLLGGGSERPRGRRPRTMSRSDVPSARRRTASVVVLSSQVGRAMTMHHRAWFAWRLPERLSRGRRPLPEEGSTGETPQRAATAASLCRPSGFSPAASEMAATSTPSPSRREAPGWPSRSARRGALRALRSPCSVPRRDEPASTGPCGSPRPARSRPPRDERARSERLARRSTVAREPLAARPRP